MVHYLVGLLNSNSIDEVVAGILLFQKLIENERASEHLALIDNALAVVSFEKICQLLNCSIEIVKRNACLMMLYACSRGECYQKLVRCLDVLLIITAKEANSEFQSLLHGVCSQIAEHCTAVEISCVLGRVYKFILYPSEGMGKLSNVEVLRLLNLCVDFVESCKVKPILSYNASKYLRNIICIHLNCKRHEVDYDSWLAVLYRQLKVFGIAWNFDLDYTKDEVGHTAKTDSFISYVCNLIFTEIHIVQEELYCLFTEEKETVLLYLTSKDNQSNANSNAVVRRYVRCNALYYRLWEFVNIFLYYLVYPQTHEVSITNKLLSTGSSSSSGKTSSIKTIELCWSDCYYEILLQLQKDASKVMQATVHWIKDLLAGDSPLLCWYYGYIIMNIHSIAYWAQEDPTYFDALLTLAEQIQKCSKCYGLPVKSQQLSLDEKVNLPALTADECNAWMEHSGSFPLDLTDCIEQSDNKASLQSWIDGKLRVIDPIWVVVLRIGYYLQTLSGTADELAVVEKLEQVTTQLPYFGYNYMRLMCLLCAKAIGSLTGVNASNSLPNQMDVLNWLEGFQVLLHCFEEHPSAGVRTVEDKIITLYGFPNPGMDNVLPMQLQIWIKGQLKSLQHSKNLIQKLISKTNKNEMIDDICSAVTMILSYHRDVLQISL